VTVSYFEWVQNLQNLLWSEEEISNKLTDILKRSFREVLYISEKEKVDMRTGAFMLGMKRVAEATKLRGFIRDGYEWLDCVFDEKQKIKEGGNDERVEGSCECFTGVGNGFLF